MHLLESCVQQVVGCLGPPSLEPLIPELFATSPPVPAALLVQVMLLWLRSPMLAQLLCQHLLTVVRLQHLQIPQVHQSLALKA